MLGLVETQEGGRSIGHKCVKVSRGRKGKRSAFRSRGAVVGGWVNNKITNDEGSGSNME